MSIVETEINSELKAKLQALEELLKSMGKVLIAFSGGVDSTFLLHVASQALDKNVLAVTASSETYPSSELAEAKALAQKMQVEHLVIPTSELQDHRFYSNPPERCYYCKGELFQQLKKLAQERAIPYIIDGANVDDSSDFRPGHKASREFGVRSPLQEVNLNKKEIRQLSKAFGIPTWDKPTFACLASRFPYGQQITAEKLQQVQQAEDFLRRQGLKTFRVRHHQETARLEIEPNQFIKLCQDPLRSQLIKHFKSLGFTYITLDLMGFRSGSMNEVLTEEQLHG